MYLNSEPSIYYFILQVNPCQHLFCSDCLQELYNHEKENNASPSVKCPLCRTILAESFPLPDKEQERKEVTTSDNDTDRTIDCNKLTAGILNFAKNASTVLFFISYFCFAPVFGAAALNQLLYSKADKAESKSKAILFHALAWMNLIVGIILNCAVIMFLVTFPAFRIFCICTWVYCFLYRFTSAFCQRRVK